MRGRKKKFNFREPRLFSARAEKEDVEKVNEILDREGRTVQDFINDCIRMYISGNLFQEGNSD